MASMIALDKTAPPPHFHTMAITSRAKALQPLTGIIAAVVMGVCAYVVRYAFIEPAWRGTACEVDGPWWCALRSGLIVFTQWNGFGVAGIAFAAFAVVRRIIGRSTERLAMSAMLTGGIGIILYNATFAAVAVIAAAIVLAEGVAKPAQLGGGSEPQRPSE